MGAANSHNQLLIRSDNEHANVQACYDSKCQLQNGPTQAFAARLDFNAGRHPPTTLTDSKRCHSLSFPGALSVQSGTESAVSNGTEASAMPW